MSIYKNLPYTFIYMEYLARKLRMKLDEQIRNWYGASPADIYENIKELGNLRNSESLLYYLKMERFKH